MTELIRSIRNYWNLAWKLGLVFSMAGFLGWGIYLGDRYREPVIHFERDFLGINPSLSRAESTAPEALPPPVGAIAPMPKPQTMNIPAAMPSPPAPALNPSPVESQLRIQGNAAPARPPEFPALPPAPVVAAPPMESLMVPIAIRAKVLVDDRYASANADWMSQVQRTMNAASQIYRINFGIDLVLTGVVRWPEALEGLNVDSVHAKLRRGPREGADILLGFVADRLDVYGYAKGGPTANGKFNGAYGLVGITPGGELAYLQGVLRSVSHLMGAAETADPTGEQNRLGSWMGDAPIAAGSSPWIDLDNRRRIMEHKGKPFMPEEPQ